MYSDTALRRSTRCLDLYRMRKEERREGGRGGRAGAGRWVREGREWGEGSEGGAAIGRSRILWPRSVDDEAQGHSAWQFRQKKNKKNVCVCVWGGGGGRGVGGWGGLGGGINTSLLSVLVLNARAMGLIL